MGRTGSPQIFPTTNYLPLKAGVSAETSPYKVSQQNKDHLLLGAFSAWLVRQFPVVMQSSQLSTCSTATGGGGQSRVKTVWFLERERTGGRQREERRKSREEIRTERERGGRELVGKKSLHL